MTKSDENLNDRSATHVDAYMCEAIAKIDAQFGKGYAKENPVLLSNFLTACSIENATCTFSKHATEVVIAIDNLSEALKSIDIDDLH